MSETAVAVEPEVKDEFNFDSLEPIEIPVKYKGKKYLLVEGSGEVVAKYREATFGALKLGPEGRPSSLQGMSVADTLIVSLCLFLIREDGARIAVPKTTIALWPNRVIAPLAKKAKEISEIDVEDETLESLEKQKEEIIKKIERFNAAKNGQSGTDTGST